MPLHTSPEKERRSHNGHLAPAGFGSPMMQDGDEDAERGPRFGRRRVLSDQDGSQMRR
jgi:hypothetical protein